MSNPSLDTARRNQLEHDGFCLFEQVIPAEFIALLRQTSEEWVEAQGAASEGLRAGQSAAGQRTPDLH